ncbi:MAG: peptidoglycan-binding domain-containing protein [Patescibacteria group bacterium]
MEAFSFPKKIKQRLLRVGAFYLALAVFSMGVPVAYAALTADIKANGSDGPVTVTNGDSWTYSWTSTVATACTLTSPTGDSGISTAGSGGPIPPGHSWYPAVGNSTTLTLNCTNGTNTTTDSVVINVIAPAGPGVTAVPPAPPAPPTLPSGGGGSAATTTPPTSGGGGGGGGGGSSGGGGGGGGGGGSSRPPTPSGQVLGVSTISDFCPYLTSYLRIGFNNDPIQVIRLQAFLKAFEKFDYVTINGVFDEATLQAVNEFQLRYKDEILIPWGISQPTGYVYIRTLGKINQILCGTSIQDVHPQVIKNIKAPVSKEMDGHKEGAGTSTLSSIPLIGQDISKGQIPDKPDKGHPSGLTAALFTWPDTGTDIVKCLYQFLLILIVLYILGSIMESVLYKDNPENILKKFYSKWATILIGLVLAFIGAYLLELWCLLLPLLLSLITSAIWMFVKRPPQPKVATSKEPVKETTKVIMLTETKK